MGRDNYWQRRPDNHDWYNPSEGFRRNRPDYRDRYDNRDGRRYHADFRERVEDEYAPYNEREPGDRYYEYDNRPYDLDDNRGHQTMYPGQSAGGGMGTGKSVDQAADNRVDSAKPGQSSGASAGVFTHTSR